MNKAITATAVDKMRRWAKQHARDTSSSYGHALEHAARDAGFASWHEVQESVKAGSAAAGVIDLPVDPELPPNFEHTANEDRPKAEVDTWWLRPFAQSRPDGTFDVRCLDGGAWDRPTYYGTAKNLVEARELARAKLDRWQEIRDTPVLMLLGSACLLVLEPSRPSMPRPVLFAAATQEDVRHVLAQWDETRTRDPGAAQLVLRAARDRAARVPSYEQVERAKRCAGGVAHTDGRPAEFQEVALLAAWSPSVIAPVKRFSSPSPSSHTMYGSSASTREASHPFSHARRSCVLTVAR